jgi:hypothetical protein
MDEAIAIDGSDLPAGATGGERGNGRQTWTRLGVTARPSRLETAATGSVSRFTPWWTWPPSFRLRDVRPAGDPESATTTRGPLSHDAVAGHLP